MTLLRTGVLLFAASAAFAAGPEIQWVRLPGGTFKMGSGILEDEGPVRKVTVKSFEIAKTLVTNKQYKACLAAGACTAAASQGAGFDGDEQPVVGVDWDQAVAFAGWVGGRLPSEAEWEYAARGAGKDKKYPWGREDATCEKAVIAGCGRATEPVCSKPAGNTAQGLCDMAGNVWEWTQDAYHPDYAGAPKDARPWEELGAGRVIRGGSWTDTTEHARCSYRGSFVIPSDRFLYLGFRPVR